MKTKEERLKLIEDEARILREEIETEKNTPWEPEGGDWLTCCDGEVSRADSISKYRLVGSEFETKEAANRANKAFTFYRRLYKLAEELNPSGKVGGDFFVSFYKDKWCWGDSVNGEVGNLFKTEKASEKACKILNRDKWVQPY